MTETAESLPDGLRHIAVIMDGNGRWAASRGLPRLMGHRRGVEALRGLVRSAISFDLPYLTVYSFSTENWRRPEGEVRGLMGLARRFVDSDLAELHKANVRIRIIGDRASLSADLLDLVTNVETKTRDNTGLNFTVAFNYGGRDELLRATRALAEKAKAGEISPEDINEDAFSSHLDTADIPDPDILIRTSGEKRISNFLLWQAAYAELLFVNVYWPDFAREHLANAIEEFRRRDRRYGGVAAPSDGAEALKRA